MDLNEVLESEDPSASLCNYAYIYGRLSPEWEKLLLEFRDACWIILYAEYIIKDRWPEAEPILLESKNIYWIAYYAKYIIKRRWPEAEHTIGQDKTEWIEYCYCFEMEVEDENGPK